MACFLVPMAEAVVTTIVRKKSKGNNPSRLVKELPSLEKMLWGGTLVLITDHIVNGELTLSFPFFTALNQIDGGMLFLKELLYAGLPMALVLTLVWLAATLLKVRIGDDKHHRNLLLYK